MQAGIWRSLFPLLSPQQWTKYQWHQGKPDQRALIRLISKYWQPRDQLHKQQVQQIPKTAGRQAECAPLRQNASVSTFYLFFSFFSCTWWCKPPGLSVRYWLLLQGRHRVLRQVLVLREQLFPSWIFKPQFSKHPCKWRWVTGVQGMFKHTFTTQDCSFWVPSFSWLDWQKNTDQLTATYKTWTLIPKVYTGFPTSS